MAGYLTRRILLGLLTLLLITMAIYAHPYMPGNPLATDAAMMNPENMPSEEDIQRMRAAYGLDKSILEPMHTGLPI